MFVSFFLRLQFLPSFMHFTSCYIERPQPELLVNIADSKFLLSVGLWESLSNRMVWIINDDVSDRESNETRIVLTL